MRKEEVKSDTISLVLENKQEKFNGRAVAKIFQGISSPRFGAEVWYRSKYWRKYVDMDFNVLCQIASSTLIDLH